MGKLIYSMITSLDGYAEAAEGGLGTGADDEEVHTFIGDVFRPVRTFLYGRRMYETMVFWETAHTEPDQPPHILQYAARLAGSRQDHLLHDAGVGLQREDQDRADLRPGRGAQAQGRIRSRPQRRRPEPRRAGDQGGPGRRVPPLDDVERGRRRQAVLSRWRPARSRAGRAARLQDRVDLRPLPHPLRRLLPQLRRLDATRKSDDREAFSWLGQKIPSRSARSARRPRTTVRRRRDR